MTMEKGVVVGSTDGRAKQEVENIDVQPGTNDEVLETRFASMFLKYT